MIPADVQALAERRATARTHRDYAASDRLREELAALGWAVKDGPDGQVLTEAPPYRVLPHANAVPDRSGEPDTHAVTIGLVVDGWAQDVRTCVGALLQHAPADAVIVLLDNGSDAADVVHELAGGRVEELHLERPAGWSEAQNALVRRGTGTLHVLMDVSTVLEGPLAPLLSAVLDGGADAAGWRGVAVEDGWQSFADAPAGEVEALLGYLIAVRRSVALEVPLPPKARFYRNADLEWSFLLRDAGKRLVAVDVAARQDRHRGYHDSDPELRERESRKTYERFLQRFRSREDLRLPR